jgi:hypothetical protein
MTNSLLGRVRFEILIDEGEIAAIAKGIDQAIRRPAGEIVTRLAKIGVDYLRTLDSRIGHPQLAASWAYQGPTTTAEGVQAIIYSKAENQTFKHSTRRATYTIRGVDLLKILEAGAKPHTIYPKLAAVLRFPATLGWHKSIFKGTFRGGTPAYLGRTSRHGLGAFLWRREPDDEVFSMKVHHPGVTGNRFIQTTKELLEERMAIEAAELLSRVRLETI